MLHWLLSFLSFSVILTVLQSSCWNSKVSTVSPTLICIIVLFGTNKSCMRNGEWSLNGEWLSHLEIHLKTGRWWFYLRLLSLPVTPESCAYLAWLAISLPPSMSICWVGHHLWSELMGSEWLKMHQPEHRRDITMGHHMIIVFLFPSPMSASDLTAGLIL